MLFFISLRSWWFVILGCFSKCSLVGPWIVDKKMFVSFYRKDLECLDFWVVGNSQLNLFGPIGLVELDNSFPLTRCN